MKGQSVTPLYTLDDMAEDAAGLLDALQIKKAHICGISMGGMIAQTIAIHHPDLVHSLISIYSTTGNPDLPSPRPDALRVLLEPAPAKRSAYIDYTVNLFRVISGSGFQFDADAIRQTAARYFDRSFCPQGTAHQLIAALLQTNRKKQLTRLSLPALVIHGDEDPLVPMAAAEDMVEAIPHADLLIMKGMGHDLPMMNDCWAEIMEAMVHHMEKSAQ
jgi:pimeloyl-ACP methyl ester carboxylesterase